MTAAEAVVHEVLSAVDVLESGVCFAVEGGPCVDASAGAEPYLDGEAVFGGPFGQVGSHDLRAVDDDGGFPQVPGLHGLEVGGRQGTHPREEDGSLELQLGGVGDGRDRGDDHVLKGGDEGVTGACQAGVEGVLLCHCFASSWREGRVICESGFK